MSMFYFRINKIKIFDSKGERNLLVFGKKKAQVKLISFIITNKSGNLPDMKEYLNANEEVVKEGILKDAVHSVVSSRILTPIENVKDNHQLTFGDTGYVLHQSDEIPECFDWQFIAYESDRNVRDTSDLVKDIINDEGFEGFSKNIGSVIKAATNPAYSAYVEIARFAINIIAKTSKKNKDDMIGVLYMSLNRTEHYFHGERKKDDVPDLTNNMTIDYSIFATSKNNS
ncbi:hypothetical protein [Rufibacter sp. DG15C]|uniref:hypothetical protein n=1 Tax=Rufibacter sp. DG15C TaxID=1379909 RepID=UPI000A9ED081|nr:hypothetical protein [Rufibacter sp. DG15C]